MEEEKLFAQIKKDKTKEVYLGISLEQVAEKIFNVIKWPKKEEGKFYSAQSLIDELKTRGIDGLDNSAKMVGKFLNQDNYYRQYIKIGEVNVPHWNIAFRTK